MQNSRHVFVLATLLLAGCAKADASPPPVDTGVHGERLIALDPVVLARLGVRTRSAKDPAGLAYLSVPGSIEYDINHYAEVGPRLDGRVVVLTARLGDRVQKGDVLAELAVPSLGEAQASAVTSTARLAAAERNAKRETDLLKRQLTTAREAELAQLELENARAEVAAARARLSALGVKPTDVRGDFRLVAPMNGVIVRRDAVLGGYLAMSANAFAIADTTTLTAVLDVHESDLPYVASGADVSFRADGLPDRDFTGKIVFISPTIEKANRVVRVRVEVPNQTGALRPGMFIRASIALPPEASKNVLLPPDAVQPLDRDDVVFVEVAPGKFAIRKVRLGRRTSEIIEVVEGLSPDDQVVVEGAFLLRGEAAKQ
jgi:cobalt-zinc-cadmium efflux system membrane fusion protein